MTKREFWRLWNGMLGYFGATVIKKSDDAAMKTVAMFLELLKIQDHDTFLKSWAITLDKKIYLPFTPGVIEPPVRIPSNSARPDGISLEQQLVMLCHELAHVIQWRDPLFIARYISSTAHRTEYETNAIRAEMEAYYSLYGSLPPVDIFVNPLKAYGCKAADLRVAKKALTILSISIEKGACGTEVGKVLRSLMLA